MYLSDPCFSGHLFWPLYAILCYKTSVQPWVHYWLAFFYFNKFLFIKKSFETNNTGTNLEHDDINNHLQDTITSALRNTWW